MKKLLMMAALVASVFVSQPQAQAQGVYAGAYAAQEDANTFRFRFAAPRLSYSQHSSCPWVLVEFWDGSNGWQIWDYITWNVFPPWDAADQTYSGVITNISQYWRYTTFDSSCVSEGASAALDVTAGGCSTSSTGCVW